LPGKTGLDLTQIFKSDIRTAHIPVVLLTARSSDLQKIEGLKSQADAYLTKPFNITELKQTINNLIANRDKVKGHYSSEIFSEEKSQATKKTDRKFISEFSLIVENNLSNEKLGVEDICKEMGISRIQLYRKVKKILDCSVNDYIVNTRLQKAKYFLQHEDFSISQIAYKTGFSSAAYFSTVFKSKFGTTPSAFKENKA
jgi:YesN/AraC family two-component response regulator